MLYLVKFQNGDKIEIDAAYYTTLRDGFVHFYKDRPEIGVKYDIAMSINANSVLYVKEAELDIKKYKVPRSYYASHDILVHDTGLDRVSSKDWQDDGVTVTAKNEAKS